MTLDQNAGFSITGAQGCLEERAVAAAMALPALLVQNKGHGHAGTAMALAPTAHVLYQRILRHDPAAPLWPGRDRFILSAGHASLLLYIQLFMTGYGLTLDDLARSRTLDAITPGHPELGHTPGVEMSTGPLGQGIASAVGLAMALRREAALRPEQTSQPEPTVFVIAGDGCLEEGVSSETASLAGSLGVDNLVAIWDNNHITIDNGTDLNFAEDVQARYRAYGWRVIDVADYRDLSAITAALTSARERTGRPTLVAVRSVIAGPAPTMAGTSAAHAGPLGVEETAGALVNLGFAPEATADQLVPPDVLAWAREARVRGRQMRESWERATPPAPPPTRAEATSTALAALDSVAIPSGKAATRKTNGAVIRALHGAGLLWGGSADLSESTNVTVPGLPVAKGRPEGTFIPFGIREHAMAAILTGIALHGRWLPYGSTYLAFSDYQRPAMRLAALMRLPVVYVFTHDSVAVGEDGPTHQPVEQVAALRSIPGLAVIRPADAAEVLAVWRHLLNVAHGPVALVLSRQDLPHLPPRPDLAEAIRGGAYVVPTGAADSVPDASAQIALIATGSEVSLALEAARVLEGEGYPVRVVSMPCVEWFEAAAPAEREALLPQALRARVAIEAGRGSGWYRWADTVVSVEEFGESGSGEQVAARRGLTLEHVLRAAKDALRARATG